VAPQKDPEAKVVLPVRVAPAGLLWVDRQAKRFGITRSEVVRRALAQIARHGWRDS
jgi:hypothetical protein